MTKPTHPFALVGRALAVLLVAFWAPPALANPDAWSFEWPRTNFDKASVDFREIRSGGPPKDGIPPIDDPQFVDWTEAADLAPTEPVIGVTLGGEMKAYPLRILMWHEIANDEIGGLPIAATFCPLCNAVIVFDRRVTIEGAERVLDFGTTGKLRKSDLVMWDRQTESWWQQFLGDAIVGDLLGQRLKIVPSRLESWENFQARAAAHIGATAQVLVPNNSGMRAYGSNPYAGYDSLLHPFLFDGETPDGIAALERVISLEDKSQAWSLALLRQKGEITTEDGVVLRWTPGQNSALDTRAITEGKDVGNVTAQKDGTDVAYFVDFAFAFHAFRPDAPIHLPE